MLEMLTLTLFEMTVGETQNYAVIATRVYILTVQCTSIYHSSWRTTASYPTALQSVSCAVEIVDYGKLKQFNNVFRIIQHVYLIINFVSTDYFISSKPRIICNSWVLTNYLEVWFLLNFKRFFMQRFMELSS